MADIIIKGGTVITVDPGRRIIEKGAVAITKDRIVAVGPTRKVLKEHRARKVIDARGKVLMPGLIDTHGHGGTTLTKNIGEHISGAAWRTLQDHLLYRSVTEDYWHAEGRLMALERLKFGTTCFMNMFGTAPRGDDSIYPEAHIRGISEVGIRSFTGIGPPRPPYPTVYSSWKNGKKTDQKFNMEHGFKTAEKTIRKCHGTDQGRAHVWVSVSRIQAPSKDDPMFKPEYMRYSKKQAQHIKRIMAEYGVGFHAHAYGGVVKWCQEGLDILGPRVLLAHCTGLSKQEIKYIAQTDTKVNHNPTARRIYSFPAICPVIEMLDAGVNVSIGTDCTGMDRTQDQFKDVKVAVLLQRLRFMDPSILPPGKVLEMITIDAARNLGIDHEVGSLEVGKKADIILINMQQPHLVPVWMIPQRLVYMVTGHDVDTVLVDGKILMEGRKVKSVNEKKVLRDAQKEGELMVERSGVAPLMGMPEKFWGHARY